MLKLDVDTLRRVSPLLDEALDLDEELRNEWLLRLEKMQPELGPVLRQLLAIKASAETNDFLEKLPILEEAQEGRKSDFHPDEVLGPYRLIQTLGVGGMGEVWLAERSEGGFKRTVALKLPILSLRRSVLVQRFERERDILASLTHANIARLYDAGISQDGQPYLALEYVQGEPVTSYADTKKLDILGRIRLLLQVMEAVQYAHANLVIHRDLKPANVLVTAQGQALLLDFGVAKLLEPDAPQADETELTRLGGRAMTLAYAAPEQVAGQSVSIRTDVWALGILAYEMFTGVRPFESATGMLGHEILNADPVRPSQRHTGAMRGVSKGLATELDTIVLKALKKTPSQRYATVNAFAEDLERWVNGQPVMAQPDSAWYRARKFVRRHTWGVGAGVIAFAALLGFTASLNAQIQKVSRERDRSERLGQFMSQVFKVSDPNEGTSQKITARELLDTAYANIQSELTRDPEMQMQLTRVLARAFTGLGALDRSETLLTTAFDRAKSTLGPDHSATLAVGSELVYLLSVRWKPQPAEALGRDVLERQRRTLGSEHPETAVTESHLASVLAMQGRFEEAIGLTRHSMQVSSLQPNRDELQLLDDKANLAFYMLKSGKKNFQEAEQIFRQLIEGYKLKLGPGNPKTLTATNGLAAVLSLQGRYDENIKVLQQAVQEASQTLGPEHPKVLDLRSNIAAAYVDKGDLDRAEPMLRELLTGAEKVEGKNGTRGAMVKYNLACVFARRGDKEAAFKLLADALDHGLIPDAALQLESETDLASLRGDPRFTKLVAEVKLKFGKK